MKITLAFEYAVKIRPKGRRRENYEWENRLAATEVDIPEVSAKAAPVVAEWRGGGNSENRARFPLRIHGERLYRRADLGKIRGLKDHEAMTATAGDPRRKWGMSGVNYVYAGATKSAPLEGDPTVGEVLSSNRGDHEQGLARWASENLLIDGMLHEPTPEPKITLRLDTGAKRMGVSFDGYARWKNVKAPGGGAATVSFRLDEAVRAKELAREMGFDDADVPNLIVHLPDALELAVERENIAAAALQLHEAKGHAWRELVMQEKGKRLADLGLTFPKDAQPTEAKKGLWFAAWNLNVLLTKPESAPEILDEACDLAVAEIRDELEACDAVLRLAPMTPWVLPLCRDAVERWEARNESKNEGVASPAL